jgi:ABC-2 type transport system permease protein
MKWYRIQAVILRHLYESRRNLDRIADTVYWPVMDIVMWGLFTIYLSRDTGARPGLVTFLMGAIILWNLFRCFQRDMAIGFLSEVWSKNLANLFSTPLTVGEYLAGLVLVNLLKGIVGMIAAGAVAWLCYAYNIFPMLPRLLPFMLNLILFALVVGVLTTGLILRFSTRIQGLTYSIAGLLMPFSCVFYPVSALPRSLHPLAWALPTTHSFEGMRQALAGRPIAFSHFGWGLALNAVYLTAAVFFFRRMFEAVRSRGLLVKVE